MSGLRDGTSAGRIRCFDTQSNESVDLILEKKAERFRDEGLTGSVMQLCA
jgi:hypothetical protein